MSGKLSACYSVERSAVWIYLETISDGEWGTRRSHCGTLFFIGSHPLEASCVVVQCFPSVHVAFLISSEPYE